MIGKTIKFELRDRFVTGLVIDKLLIDRQFTITTPSGLGGTLRNECTQYIAVTAYFVKSGDEKLYEVYPYQIKEVN